jgi:DNA-binding IclR family transcriptional regulator
MADSTIKSARRVFEVLEHFDAVRSPLTLKQICDRYGYPPSSGTAILKSLVTLGYLEYDKRSRTYLPTMRIAALGSWVASELFGSLNILSLMEDLRDQTGESVLLATESDLYAQYVHIVHSREADTLLPLGVLRNLGRSGLGRLLLSRHDDRAIRAIVRRIDAQRGADEARIDLDELMADVTAFRHAGFATSHDLVTPGVGIIGILLPPTPFGRVFAIGLGGPWARLSGRQTDHLPALRETARLFADLLR